MGTFPFTVVMVAAAIFDELGCPVWVYDIYEYDVNLPANSLQTTDLEVLARCQPSVITDLAKSKPGQRRLCPGILIRRISLTDGIVTK
jgi:hypothetical protein